MKLQRLAVIALAQLGCDAIDSGPEIDESAPESTPLDLAPLAAAAQPSANGWVWIDVPGTRCRDGSSTGLGLRLAPNASGLMFYLQGGGGCWDAASCEENANVGFAGASFGKSDFDRWAAFVGEAGIFNRGRSKNPYAAWHQVYVPYCTGDFHAGTRPNVAVAGVAGRQQFVGDANMSVFIGLLGPALPTLDAIALTGSSAGAFGATINYGKIAAAAAPTPVTLVADAGPFLPFMPGCFQNRVNQTFGLALPADCPACALPWAGGLANLYPYFAAKYPRGSFGVDSALFDATLAFVLDREAKSCGEEPVGLLTYFFWVLHLREVLVANNRVSTFLWSGLEHTFLQSDALLYSEGVGANTLSSGVRPIDWISGLTAGPPQHILPE